MRSFALSALFALMTIAACGGGGTITIGANSAAGTGEDGGTCKPFIEPPLDPGFCGGSYEASYDEHGCKVGYHCVDAGSCSAYEPPSIQCDQSQGPLTTVVTFDSSTGCANAAHCGLVLTEANAGQTIEISNSHELALEIRLKVNASGDWAPALPVTQTFGAPHKEDNVQSGADRLEVFTWTSIACTTETTTLARFDYVELGADSKTFEFDLHCTP